LDSVVQYYDEGQTILIPSEVKHRIDNKSKSVLVFMEVQTGTYFGEGDIVRIEDYTIEFS